MQEPQRSSVSPAKTERKNVVRNTDLVAHAHTIPHRKSSVVDTRLCMSQANAARRNRVHEGAVVYAAAREGGCKAHVYDLERSRRILCRYIEDETETEHEQADHATEISDRSRHRRLKDVIRALQNQRDQRI